MTKALREAALRLKLLDDVSGPAAKAARALGELDAKINQFTRRRDAAMRDLGAASAQFAAAIGALALPTLKAGAFETSLENIRQKIDGTTESMRRLSEEIRKSGLQSGVGAQRSAATYDTLLGLGASEKDASGMAPSINRASTAYQADTGQLSQAVYSSSGAFGIAASDTGRSLDILAESGKRGAVELSDMAKALPSLSAQFSALGQKGLPALADIAAQLQIVRKSTGNADEAAVALQNFLSSLTGAEASKRLKEAGINLSALQKESAKTGASLVDLILDRVQKVTKGDPEKLAEIFPDRESQRAIRPLMANRQELSDIRAGSLQASGVVDRDFESRIQTFEGKLGRLKAGIKELTISLGEKLLPTAKSVVDTFIRVVDRVDAFVDRNGELVATVAKVSVALLGLRVASAGARLALWSTVLPVAKLARGILGFGTSAAVAASEMIRLQTALKGGAALSGFETFAAGLRGLAMAVPGIGALSSALAGIGAALAAISGPAWLAIAAGVAVVAAAGAMVYRYWDRLAAIFSGVGRALSEQFAPAIQAVRPVLDALAPVGDAVAAGWEKAKAALAAFGEWISGFFQREVLSDGQKAEWESAGHEAATRMIEAVKTKVSELVSWFRELPGRIAAAIGSIDLGRLVKWPALPSWLGGGGGQPSAAPPPAGAPLAGARAAGGPVRRGLPYLVGEKGPEIFQPGQSGRIIPNHQIGGGPSIHAPVTVNLTQNINGHGAHDLQKLAADAARTVTTAITGQLDRQLNRSSQTTFGGLKPYGEQ